MTEETHRDLDSVASMIYTAARCEVLTGVLLRNQVLRDKTLC